MSLYGRAHGGGMAIHGPFAIILVLEGNRDMVTIPPKKMKVYPEMSKKFCGATALDNSTIVSLSSCQKTTGVSANNLQPRH
jgi:hypothetical protein